MSNRAQAKEALGCLFFMAIAAISLGVGNLFGAGFGFLLFGGMLLLLWILA